MAWQSGGRTNEELVRNLMRNGLIETKEVASAMQSVDRGAYVPLNMRAYAYDDAPQPIGYGATISAPHMHAMCLELLRENLRPGSKALDIGSGSGYLSACMAAMVGPTGHVVGIEHMCELADWSVENIKKANPELEKYITILCADGRKGYPDMAPYDAIHVGAASPSVPETLLEQLKVGGRLVIPVGDEDQSLWVIQRVREGKDRDAFKWKQVCGVRYVPLTDAEKQRKGGW